MGYDVHITRAESWSENGDAPISLEEWERFVDDDPELAPDPENGMPMAVWSAHPGGDEVGSWLSWNNGNITTKNPDEPLLGKMLQIAACLNARVQGDDGEEYPLADAHKTERRIGRTLLTAVATGIFAAIAIPLGLYLDSYVLAEYGGRGEAPIALSKGSVLLGLLGVVCVPFGVIATFVSAGAKQQPAALCILAAISHGFAIAFLYFAD